MNVDLCLVSHPVNGARQLAGFLVETRLAACVQILPPMTSIYRWEGQVESAEEVVLLIKCHSQKRSALQAAIVEKHPYEIPEILFFTADSGLPSYLDWVTREAGWEA